MNKMDVEHLFQNFWKGVRKHSPEIFMGMGIAGFFGTTGLAVWATPEAMRRLEDKRERVRRRKLTAIETVEATWKCYIPAAVTGTLSAACVIGSERISSRRNAALATAYALSESVLREYRNKVIETIGERKETEICNEIDRERVEKNPPEESLAISTVEATGLTLCYDAAFGRYFHSTIENIRRAENKLNRQMATMCEPYISLNEFYREIDAPDLPPVDIGDQLGWNLDKGLIEVRFSSQLAWGRVPCLVMSYELAPNYNYF